jgi:hypothetical protein
MLNIVVICANISVLIMNNSFLETAQSSFSFLKIPHVTGVNISNSQLVATADSMYFDGQAV